MLNSGWSNDHQRHVFWSSDGKPLAVRTKTVLLSDIQWDDKGMGVEECNLPLNVLVFKVPIADDEDEVQEIDDRISDQLSDNFGFCHYGYVDSVFDDTVLPTHGGGGFMLDRLGVMEFVE